MTLALDGPTRIFGLEHFREVEHGYVGLSVVVDGEFEVGEEVFSGEDGSLENVEHKVFGANVFVGEEFGGVGVVVEEDAFLEETVFLGGHDKVVGLVLVVDDVLEVDAGGLVEVLEEFLVEDVRDAGDLLDARLGLGVFVDKVCGDCNGKFSPESLSSEAVECVASAVGADEDVEGVVWDGVVGGTGVGSPALVVGWLSEALEADAFVDLNAEEQSDLEQDALKLANANVVDWAGAELAVKLFGSKGLQVCDEERPQVEHIVAGEPISLLHEHHLCTQHLRLDGGTEAAGAGADDEHSGPKACLPSAVTFVRNSLLKLGPQALRSPRGQLTLQIFFLKS